MLAQVLLSLVLSQSAVTGLLLTAPSPTSMAVSLQWTLQGDDDLDATCTVRYRVAGTSAWTVGPPLLRVPAGQNTTGSFGTTGGQWINKFSGSVWDLRPGTTYEFEVSMHDPDGGDSTSVVTVTTRAEPAAAADSTVIEVTPATVDAALDAAQPGQILLLGAGTYGALTLSHSGTEGRPIVLRGVSRDEVIIDGRVNVFGQAWVMLEDVTVKAAVRLNDSSNVTVRRTRIVTTENGIDCERGSVTPHDNTFVDNEILGSGTWDDAQLSAGGFDDGEGIQVTGPGHVICFNRVVGFRDAISLMEYDLAYEQQSIDICNNDIERATDDAIEADSAMGNVRVLRNRITNAFDGLSSQPNLGGPTYFVRNTMFNVLYTPFKFHNGTVGDQVFHNTVLKNGDAFGCYAGATWSRAVFRNNLLLGGPGGTWGGYGNGSGRVLDLADADGACSFDYDGLGSTTGTFTGRIGSVRFNDLAELRAMTTEVHAQQVDLSVFAAPPAFPADAFPEKAFADFRLAPGGAAVDQGVVLVGVNDDFGGTAPDLGALELGQAQPWVGPRPTGGGAGDAGAGGGGGAEAGGGGGGAAMTDAGGTTGGGSGADAGTEGPSAGSCGCGQAPPGWGLFALGGLLARRRRLG